MAYSEIKLAYFILCHKAPEQVIRLIKRLRDAGTVFVVHVDKRARPEVYDALRECLAGQPDVIFSERHRCYWGRIGIVRGTISCIKKAVQLNLPFDYAFLLSGEDYPIKTNEQIRDFLSKNTGKQFIESFALDKPNRWSDHDGAFNPVNRVLFWTFFFRSKRLQLKARRQFPLGFRPHLGSQWWCLSRDCIEYVNAFIDRYPEFVRYFNWVFIPDECFFQSILSNSPYASKVAGDGIRYADWSNPNPTYPKTLLLDDFEKLTASPALFARKIDAVRSQLLIDKIDEEVGHAHKAVVESRRVATSETRPNKSL